MLLTQYSEPDLQTFSIDSDWCKCQRVGSVPAVSTCRVAVVHCHHAENSKSRGEGTPTAASWVYWMWMCEDVHKAVDLWGSIQGGGCVGIYTGWWICVDLYRVVDVWGSTQGSGCVGIYTGWWMCRDLYRVVDV